MEIKQFYDEGLAHASYAIVSEGEMAVIDPARDPQQYYDFAQVHEAKITTVLETHPHADFVSSHLEIHQDTGATIYNSKLLGADYPHEGFDEGQSIALGKLKLKALNTPGHSPDSITIVLEDEKGEDHALFTGDTLFVGDVGRPDLRESVGNMTAKREELARQMYHSTREKLLPLNDELLVYPAHGAGSLCGKNLSPDTFSTLGRERKENPALAPMSEDDFVSMLLDGQPFIPKYFTYAVETNKNGAPQLAPSLARVPRISSQEELNTDYILVDTRSEAIFKRGHLKGAINIQNGGKFETWLGSIIGADEKFYLLVQDEATATELIKKSSKIGYEQRLAGVWVVGDTSFEEKTATLNLADFKASPENYTIVDIRNTGEYAEGAIFPTSLSIPLPELRERKGEIPTEKPVVVHCAAGYRSAAGSSILEDLSTQVYDLSEAVKEF